MRYVKSGRYLGGNFALNTDATHRIRPVLRSVSQLHQNSKYPYNITIYSSLVRASLFIISFQETILRSFLTYFFQFLQKSIYKIFCDCFACVRVYYICEYERRCNLLFKSRGPFQLICI